MMDQQKAHRTITLSSDCSPACIDNRLRANKLMAKTCRTVFTDMSHNTEAFPFITQIRTWAILHRNHLEPFHFQQKTKGLRRQQGWLDRTSGSARPTTCYFGIWVLFQVCIQNSVTDLVTDLICRETTLLLVSVHLQV